MSRGGLDECAREYSTNSHVRVKDHIINRRHVATLGVIDEVVGARGHVAESC